MPNGRARKTVFLSLALLIGSSYFSPLQPSSAAPSASAAQSSTINETELALLENRYFSHAYAHDPIEKRLERLECLVFGSTREGNNAERLNKLSQSVARRSQTPVPVEKAPAENGQSASGSAGKSGANAQYPVLTTLEWKALKKTYPAESLDQRLDRLESKLFGQPAQTMAYIDRVDRLKKILGIGLNMAGTPDGITARGPAPKARAHGEFEAGDGFNGPGAPIDGFSMPGAGLQGTMPPVFNPFSQGPSSLDTVFGATFNQQMRQMMQDMNRQLNDAQRPGNGNGSWSYNHSWTYDPRTNSWIDETGKRMAPGNQLVQPQQPGFRGIAPVAPSSPGRVRELPPYADPNSI